MCDVPCDETLKQKVTAQIKKTADGGFDDTSPAGRHIILQLFGKLVGHHCCEWKCNANVKSYIPVSGLSGKIGNIRYSMVICEIQV
jgi:hypothetical protein